MAERKQSRSAERKGARQTGKKSKSALRPKPRRERRFEPQQTHTTKTAFVIGLVGALLLGAGVYAQWLRDSPLEYSPFLLIAGAAGLIGSMIVGGAGLAPIRIGDLGVAVEKKGELVRVPWCDIERIHVDGQHLVLEGEEQRLRIPLAAQRVAAAWVLREAARRVPDVLDVKQSVVDELPLPKEDDGERVAVEVLQITGRRCAATDKVITFEREARVCPTCAQVYHKDSVPKVCVTCEEPLGEKALQF
jgi:hypothetical protein